MQYWQGVAFLFKIAADLVALAGMKGILIFLGLASVPLIITIAPIVAFVAFALVAVAGFAGNYSRHLPKQFQRPRLCSSLFNVVNQPILSEIQQKFIPHLFRYGKVAEI